jgi:hypothetical protein
MSGYLYVSRGLVNSRDGFIDYCALAVSAMTGGAFVFLASRMWGWSLGRRATVAGLYALGVSGFWFLYAFSLVCSYFGDCL